MFQASWPVANQRLRLTFCGSSNMKVLYHAHMNPPLRPIGETRKQTAVFRWEIQRLDRQQKRFKL